nr:TRAP transporter small permease [Desulfofundulus thermobenzoicus]
MATVIFAQVVARYALHNSLTWSEEVGRYAFVWITFFGAALAVKERSHVALDNLVKNLPITLQKIILFTGYMLMIIFSMVMAYAGWQIFELGANQLSAATQIPMKWVYIAIPAGSVLIIVYLLKNLIEDMGKRGS